MAVVKKTRISRLAHLRMACNDSSASVPKRLVAVIGEGDELVLPEHEVSSCDKTSPPGEVIAEGSLLSSHAAIRVTKRPSGC